MGLLGALAAAKAAMEAAKGLRELLKKRKPAGPVDPAAPVDPVKPPPPPPAPDVPGVPWWRSRSGWATALVTVAAVAGWIGGCIDPGAKPIIPLDPPAVVEPPPVGDPPPPEGLFGWAGPAEVAATSPAILADMPQFLIVGAEGDNSKRRVVLWDAAKKVNGGKHLPTFRQEIGSCVGHGYGHAAQYLQAVQSLVTGAEYKPVYVPYHYACGRNAPDCGAGRLGRNPSGSVGSWQAKALTLYGVLPADLPGLEPDGARVISAWAVRMPEQKWVAMGDDHPVRTAALVRTADEVRDAICNGYPVAICSDWGGLMRPPVVDGRLVNRRATTWAHCMVLIGYDGSGREPFWYVLNSWGPAAHGEPPDDAPPGGFWVRKSDIDYIVRQGDSFALSDAVGFPSKGWDFAAIPRRQAAPAVQAAAIAF